MASIGVAEAASKKKPKKEFEYTSEQRARIMASARKLCKQKYGPTSTAVNLQIMKNSRQYRVSCTTY